MAEHKEWVVELVVTTVHNYTVLARTAEEAVNLAEDLLDSGEEGEIVETSVENSDAVSGEIYAERDEELVEEEENFEFE